MWRSIKTFLGSALGAASLDSSAGPDPRSITVPTRKRHIVSLSFDDGYRWSSLRTAEIFEKFNLSACLNVLAVDGSEDPCIRESPLGDFQLWNELKQRGHEIMPHGYRHENLQGVSFQAGKDLIRRCLDTFRAKLDSFDPKQAIFNFPYNASTPELDQWLPSQVRAFRAGRGSSIHCRTRDRYT